MKIGAGAPFFSACFSHTLAYVTDKLFTCFNSNLSMAIMVLSAKFGYICQIIGLKILNMMIG